MVFELYNFKYTSTLLKTIAKNITLAESKRIQCSWTYDKICFRWGTVLLYIIEVIMVKVEMYYRLCPLSKVMPFPKQPSGSVTLI